MEKSAEAIVAKRDFVKSPSECLQRREGRSINAKGVRTQIFGNTDGYRHGNPTSDSAGTDTGIRADILRLQLWIPFGQECRRCCEIGTDLHVKGMQTSSWPGPVNIL